MTNLLRTIEETGEILETATKSLSPEALLLLFTASIILLLMMDWEERRQAKERDEKI